jgi:mannose/cellobiose epimerase-like protein (N-acyl-D-glucosamine 2-epimerase family)
MHLEFCADERRRERWFETLHEYAGKRFPGSAFGLWFSYLRRDGSIANDAKDDQ